MAPRSDVEINQLVRDIIEASKKPPKARATSIKPTVANLTSLAFERGLLPDALGLLIGLVTSPTYLDQASLAAIVRNLYPATRVSRDIILQVLSCFGHGKFKPSLNLQAALLRWLILIYHVLETPAVLSQAYTVLFNLLGTAATRPQLSHLLALITRRKHVRPFRTQMLLGLSRNTGNDPCLVGLLRVFKNYYPEIIVGDAVRGKAAAFKHPDPQWRERVDEIQEAHLQSVRDGLNRPRNGFQVARPANRSLGNKVVPTVHTSHATESSVTLEEVENAKGFAQTIDKIELPNQLIAVLADPLLQKFLLLRPSEQAYQRVANWLGSALQEVMDGDTDETTLWEVLDVLRDFVVQTKTLPPIVLNFFAQFFRIWNGSGPRDIVLDILSFSPLHDFEELYQHILQPLEYAILDNNPDTQLAVLGLYTKLLHHWTSVLKSMDDIPREASASVTALVFHVNILALTLIQTSPTLLTESSILEFYEQFARLVTDNTLTHHIRIELAPGPLIYTLLLSNSLVTVSRLCYVLVCYKKGFETAMSNRARRDSAVKLDFVTYDRAYVNLYNGYLMDMCNCFWRARAFSDSDSNTHGCMIPRPTVSALTSYISSVDNTFALASMLSLSHSPVLCLQSIQQVREIEDAAMDRDNSIRLRHAGPVTQTSLTRLATAGGIQLSWQEYRINVLESLTRNGLVGIPELLQNTMTVLRTTMEGRSKLSS